MKPKGPFRRLLSYCGAYRHQLGGSVLLALLIGVLWMSGIAAVAPVLKTMLDEHGLHGWADQLSADDSLGIQTEPSPEGESGGILVKSVRPGGPAAAAGLRPWDVLLRQVGDGEAGAAVPPNPADPYELYRVLAAALDAADRGVRLLVRSGVDLKNVSVRGGEAGLHLRMLRGAVGLLPVDRFWALAMVMGLLLGVTALRAVVEFVQDYTVSRVSDAAVMDLRNDVYRNVVHLPLAFFGRKGTNEAMSRFIQDSNQMQYAVKTLFAETVREPFKAAGVLVLAFAISWQSMLLVLALAPAGWAVIHVLGRKMRKSTRRMLSRWGRLLGIMEETLFGIRVVKAYTMEGYERERFRAENRELLRQQFHMHKIDTASGPLMETLGTACAAAMIVLLSRLVFDKQMDPQNFMLFVICLVGVFDPLRKLSKVNNRIQAGAAGATRMFELLDAQPEDVETGEPFPRPDGTLRFEGVHFAYDHVPVLEDISFEVPVGTTVAVVGQTGSGKTTLVSLIPRFFEPTAGRITIGGRDLKNFSLASLRARIGLVSQDPVLFADTIFNNIAYGRADQDEAVIRQAAQKAFADEFIEQIPDGYKAMVGEHGTNLSGGQKQRLTLARAIARDPDILILDEATSAVDRDTEAEIQAAIADFIKGRTTFIIAHRLSTVRHANLILVLDAGRLVASGTHEELIASSDLYRRLYATTLTGKAEEDAG